ncbi:MAG: hypothetical protein JW902_12125 [Syntrophaceae bacterium]|nr:hypothetical protein [Syntrophaceae bacterium]
MSLEKKWQDIIIHAPDPAEAWAGIFKGLLDCASATPSPVELHKQTIPADRLLSEASWELWKSYSASASITSTKLVSWCKESVQSGKAVLILDALSLNELPLILGGARNKNSAPSKVSITGSEIPSDTDSFARALGVPSRSSFQNNRAPSGFKLFKGAFFTEVFAHPFADCCGLIPPAKNVFIWHTWLDDMIHLYKKTPDQIHSAAIAAFQSDDFWKFINTLRQGRTLVITGDHGYTNSRLFSSEETEQENIEAFRNTFSASRYASIREPWNHSCMPPCVLSTDDYHVIMGQKKWKVQGGFPALCHGGLTLLEVAVPFIEIPAL